MFDCKLLKGNVLVSIEKSGWVGTAKGDMDKVETDANKKMLGITKQLFDRKASKEYQAILKERRLMQRYIESNSFPSYFKPGIVVVKESLVDNLKVEIAAHKIRLKNLATKFANTCPDLFLKAINDLKSQFRWQDYPGFLPRAVALNMDAQLREERGFIQIVDLDGSGNVNWYYRPLSIADKFQIEYIILQINVPEGLEPEVREEEERKLRERFEACENKITEALYQGFLKILNNVVDRLTPDDDGKRKRFTGDLFNSFIDFVSSIKARNVLSDSRIEELCVQAQSVLEAVAQKGDLQSALAAERLKDYDRLREDTASKFTAIQEAVEKEIEKIPVRSFDFTEEMVEA